MRMYSLIPKCLTLFLPILVSSAASGQGGFRTPLIDLKQNPCWVYEAERVSKLNGQVLGRSRTAYFRGRYKTVEEQFAYSGSAGLASPKVETRISANTWPPASWIYDEKLRSANIDQSTAFYNFVLLVRKLGKETVRTKYHVPARLLDDKLIYGRHSLLHHSFNTISGLYLVYDFDYAHFSKEFRKIGKEKVAGQMCLVFEEIRNDAAPGRYWIEPRSHFVLRTEHVTPDSTRQKLDRSVGTTTKFAFRKSLPAELFELPPGTTAYLPESMKDYPLPHGVIRKPMTGKEALLGFDPETALLPQKPVGNGVGMRLVK